MSHSNGWPVAETMSDLLGQQERRMGIEERRPRVTKASDLLGPLAGPQAILVDNLNSDLATFNGWIVVPPGAFGSPDTGKWWIGWIVTSEEGGTQMLTTMKTVNIPHEVKIRSWDIVGDGTRAYSPWEDLAGGGPAPLDYAEYMRTATFAVPDGVSSLPARSSGTDVGGVAWDDINARFEVSVPGLYQIDAVVPWNNFGTAFRRDLILDYSTDGSTWANLTEHRTQQTGVNSNAISTTKHVSETDIGGTAAYFRFLLYQNTGGPTNNSANRTRITVARVA